jgi:hypothetical protein
LIREDCRHNGEEDMNKGVIDAKVAIVTGSASF